MILLKILLSLNAKTAREECLGAKETCLGALKENSIDFGFR